MKRTLTVLLATIFMVSLASCMDAAGNENHNPIRVGDTSITAL